MTKVVSFKKIGKDVASEPTADAEDNTSSAVVPRQSEAVTNYDGAGDNEDGYDQSDIKLPRIKLLQGTSDKKLLAQFGFGSLLLKDTVVLAKPAGEDTKAVVATIVFVKLISKTYTEKVDKFGDPSGFARSLSELEEMGGTADWRQSKLNKRISSDKPWYQVNANCLVLVQKPEGAEEDHFPFEAEGKFYAPALFSVVAVAFKE